MEDEAPGDFWCTVRMKRQVRCGYAVKENSLIATLWEFSDEGVGAAQLNTGVG